MENKVIIEMLENMLSLTDEMSEVQTTARYSEFPADENSIDKIEIAFSPDKIAAILKVFRELDDYKNAREDEECYRDNGVPR